MWSVKMDLNGKMVNKKSQEHEREILLDHREGIFEQHIYDSYFNLRTGITLLTVLLPLVLLIWGYTVEGDLRESMSHYYLDINGRSMRDWFVGSLWAIGVFLILYKGWERKECGALNENWALNLAGLSAIGVAIFPTQPESISIHGICAVSLFLLMAYVCRYRALDTLSELSDKKLRIRFKKIYMGLGALMLATPIIAWCLAFAFQGLQQYKFWIEAIGVWFFALYWTVKSMELSLSGMECMVPYFPLEPLPENQSRHFKVEPGLLDYPTGIEVDEGEQYRFTTNEEGRWLDWFIPCGPEGWGQWFPLKQFNRKCGEPFFMLCGNIDKIVDDDDLSFCIGKEKTWVVPELVKNGNPLQKRQLYLFANDIPIAYGNNRKHPRRPLVVTITRIRQEAT